MWNLKKSEKFLKSGCAAYKIYDKNWKKYASDGNVRPMDLILARYKQFDRYSYIAV